MPAGKKIGMPTFLDRMELMTSVWLPVPSLETPFAVTMMKLPADKFSYCGLDLV
jgi:hypothetical protein